MYILFLLVAAGDQYKYYSHSWKKFFAYAQGTLQIIQIRFKFLAEGDPQERKYSPFASQKRRFHHLKTVFLPPKTYVFGV